MQGIGRPVASAAGAPTALSGEGGDFEAPLISALQDSSGGEAAVAPLVSTFFNPGVDVARQDFVGKSVTATLPDYVVSEFPLTAAEAGDAAQIGRSFAYVPFAVSGVAISALVECDQTTSVTPTTFCPDLQMSPAVLADTLGTVGGSWNDSTYDQLSGGHPVRPTVASIQPLNQIDPSMDNYAPASYLLGDPSSAPIWETFQKEWNQTAGVPSELWPTDAGVQGIVTILANMEPDNPATDLPDTNPQLWDLGAVAPLPADWLGPPYTLPTVALQNAAGDDVAPTVASLTAAADDATMDPGTNLVTFPADDPDPKAYPIPVVSYLVVPTSGLAGPQAAALASFIRYVLSPPAQSIMATYDTAPPTQAMINAGLRVADEVAAQSGPAPGTPEAPLTPLLALAGAAVVAASVVVRRRRAARQVGATVRAGRP